MVTPRSDIHAPHNEHGEHFHGVKEMIHTLGKVASLQFQILALRIKESLAALCLAMIFLIAAISFAAVAVIFLDIAIYEALTRGVGSIFASLIFAGIHVIAAALAFFAGKKYFGKSFSNSETKSQGGSHEK